MIQVNKWEFDMSKCSVLRLLLPHINLEESPDSGEESVWSGGKAFNTYLEAACGKSAFQKARLIDLLHELPRRESHIPRDRLYSLRSLTSDGASIGVDYDSTNEHVMLQFLNFLKDSLCLCTWMQLVGDLDSSAHGTISSQEARSQ
jgi:hypothetical protein